MGYGTAVVILLAIAAVAYFSFFRKRSFKGFGGSKPNGPRRK